jgi:hypothetical protein
MHLLQRKNENRKAQICAFFRDSARPSLNAG